jgi:tetratricopeptide (TPR) repeat protein
MSNILKISILFILLISQSAVSGEEMSDVGLPVKIKKGIKYYKFDNRWLKKGGLGKRIAKIKKYMEEDKKHKDWENAYVKKTRHYIIKTNYSKRLLERSGVLFESIYTQYSKMFRGQKGFEKKLSVNIFKNGTEYNAFVKKHVPGLSGTIGFHSSRKGMIASFATNKKLFGTLLHEGCHQFVGYTIGYNLPVWFSEGCPCYFEGTFYKKGKLSFGHIYVNRLLRLKKIFRSGKSVNLKQITSKVGKPAVVDYAYGWGLVYYLGKAENGKYKKGFKKYVNGLKRGKYNPEELFRECFFKKGDTYDSFEKKWKKFILELPNKNEGVKRPHWFSYPKIPDIPKEWYRREFKEAKIALKEGNYKKALSKYIEVYKSFPKTNMAVKAQIEIMILKGMIKNWWEQGEKYYEKGEYIKAEKFYKKIIEHFPKKDMAEKAKEKLKAIEKHKEKKKVKDSVENALCQVRRLFI